MQYILERFPLTEIPLFFFWPDSEHRHELNGFLYKFYTLRRSPRLFLPSKTVHNPYFQYEIRSLLLYYTVEFAPLSIQLDKHIKPAIGPIELSYT